MPDLNHPWYVAMRKWGDKAAWHFREFSKLRPRYGEIALGSSDMDHWFRWLAINEFLGVLRKGDNPKQALTHAQEQMKEAIQRWNGTGCKVRVSIGGSHQLHYWEGHCGDTLQAMLIEFSRLPQPRTTKVVKVTADGTMGIEPLAKGAGGVALIRKDRVR